MVALVNSGLNNLYQSMLVPKISKNKKRLQDWRGLLPCGISRAQLSARQKFQGGFGMDLARAGATGQNAKEYT